jgi:hypothetical protein
MAEVAELVELGGGGVTEDDDDEELEDDEEEEVDEDVLEVVEEVEDVLDVEDGRLVTVVGGSGSSVGTRMVEVVVERSVVVKNGKGSLVSL